MKTPQRFRKKPVEIEAIQWTTENPKECMRFVNSGVAEVVNDTLLIKTLEGVMTASKNDWIIRGVNGEYYPCKPDIFLKTYDKDKVESNFTEFDRLRDNAHGR